MSHDFDAILASVRKDCLPLLANSRPADYIPELARVDPRKFGMVLRMNDGRLFRCGDTEETFSLQSISKVLVLAMVMPRINAFERVGVEPSGNAYNSLVQLERERGIPRNPLINAGALVATDLLVESVDDPVAAVIDYVRRLCRKDAVVEVNEAVARSEYATADTNRALAYLMRSFGNLNTDVERLLDVYCHHCALEMTLTQLSNAFAFLANGGCVPETNERIITSSQAKRLNAVMLTCGFYDESGEFAYRVGLPGKSGVGGGIITVLPGQFTLATWSPGLNAKGNSLAGMHALELFTSRTGLSLC